MIESKYSTKQISQIFNVGRETLRHYERLGFLNPKINPDNGYREYGYWDICTMIDILKYRSLGLSLAETKENMYSMDPTKIIGTLENHMDYFNQKIMQYQLLLKKVERDLMYLRGAKDHLFELAETEVESFFIVPYTTDPSNEYFSSMQKAFENSYFFTTVLTIDGVNQDLDCYGLLTEKKYAEFLKIEKGITLEKIRVVSQMIDIVGRDPVNESIVTDFKKTISKKYSRTFDTIYAVLVSRFYDEEKRYHQYFMVFARLE